MSIDRADAPPQAEVLVGLAESVRSIGSRLIVADPGPDRSARIGQLLAEVQRLLQESGERPQDGDARPWQGDPVTGRANYLAPPVQIHHKHDGRTIGRVALSAEHEGPTNCAHGGVVAAILDGVMANVTELRGAFRVTKSLEVRYRAPTPLGTPLVFTAWSTATAGRTRTVLGTVSTEAAPEVVLVECRVEFVLPRAPMSRFGSAGRDIDSSAGKVAG